MEKGNGQKLLRFLEGQRINILENIKMRKNVDKGNLFGLVVTVIKENIKMMKEMGMVKWYGLIIVDILDNGSMVFSMDMVRWYFLMGRLKKDILKIICLLVKLIKVHLLKNSINSRRINKMLNKETLNNLSKKFIKHLIITIKRKCKNNILIIHQ